ncbi:MAG TPA: Uma2 family endonuclease [Verrucomicrobiales bacterium]|nr:Uma2 family endonuclease [Verrucomicrobiales bacterium]
MNSFLETLETRELVVPISRTFYHEAAAAGLLDRDVELLRGIILKKMPKSPYHILLVRRLYSLLTSALEEATLSERYFVSKEDPIAIGDSEPEPDLAIIAGNPEHYSSALPHSAELVIEVAVHTLERDRLKAAIYAEAGVSEYWIVDAGSKRIERHSLAHQETATYLQRSFFEVGNTLSSTWMPSLKVDLSVLFSDEGTS